MSAELSELARRYEGRSILVTGGRGYIGSALTAALAHVRCRLLVIDRSPAAAWRPESARAEVALRRADLSRPAGWEGLPRLDVVFHLAGMEYVHRARRNPREDYEANALPAFFLARSAARRRSPLKAVFASSANLYGAPRAMPVSEAFPDRPLTVWAVHKLAAEHFLASGALEGGLDAVALRFANVYGPVPRRGAAARPALNRAALGALRGEGLTLYSNSARLRDHLYIDDAVAALLRAGLGRRRGFRRYVVGSGQRATFERIWKMIALHAGRLTGRKVPVRRDARLPLEACEERDFVADSGLFRAETGWAPGVLLDEGVRRCVEFLAGGERR